MSGKRKKTKQKPLPPAGLIQRREVADIGVKITVMEYSTVNNSLAEYEIKSVEDLKQRYQNMKSTTVCWVNINGIHDAEIVDEVCRTFEIHALTVEDILDTRQRPKYDDYGEYLYIDAVSYKYDAEENDFISEQIGIVIKKNLVISFTEREKDSFNLARTNIRNETSRVRRYEADYLAYVLIDIIIDDYFYALEQLSYMIEDLEENVLDNPQNDTLQQIQRYKRQLFFMHKLSWSMRDIVNSMSKRDSLLLSANLSVYLRDLYDHIIQVIDTTETLRDLISGILDIYLTTVSNRLNEIMKVLTIISTIFIPLSFIVGFYGMNFVYMPELQMKYAYPAVVIFMAAIGFTMLMYFKKKKWW